MKDKIFQFLSEGLDEFELNVLKRDLENGGESIKQLIEKRLRILKRSKQKECMVCGRSIDGYQNKLLLHFGPDDFQKRASFCAVDCLEYFLKKMKKKFVEEREPVSERV